MIREFFHSQILLISHMQLLSEVKEWVCLAKNDLARIFPCAVFHNDPIGSLHISGVPSEDNTKVHNDINDKVM